MRSHSSFRSSICLRIWSRASMGSSGLKAKSAQVRRPFSAHDAGDASPRDCHPGAKRVRHRVSAV